MRSPRRTVRLRAAPRRSPAQPVLPALAVLASAALAAPAAGQRLHLVEDVNDEVADLQYHREQQVATLGGWRYFARDVAGLGVELWRSEVATGALELVHDLRPGPDGSRPDLLTPFGGALYFSADDGVHGNELWRTDGTSAGTALVRDLKPGPNSGFAAIPSNRKPFTLAAGELWFAADGKLWHSDGTTAGTQVVPGGAQPAEITAFGPGVYFRGSFSTLLRATPAGVNVVHTFSGGPNDLTVFQGALYFHAAGTPQQGYELWRSDGTTAGTALLLDIYPGTTTSESSYPSLLTPVGKRRFFTAKDAAHGRARN